MLVHLATDNASLERVRAEFRTNTGANENLTYDEMAKESVTMENCSELDYLTNVLYEALRYNPPAPGCTPYHY